MRKRKLTARLILVVTFVSLITGPTATAAVKRVGDAEILSISQATGRIYGNNNKDFGLLSATNQFQLRVGDSVTIGVQDPNPILYVYKASDVTKTENADYTAALSFAKSLNALLSSMGTAAVTPVGPRPVPEIEEARRADHGVVRRADDGERDGRSVIPG